ncbi:MAG: hypothetical protein VX344_04885 [Bacteroidota bacterium]|nr:hypothetical protein [Bacteroidota bacterium]
MKNLLYFLTTMLLCSSVHAAFPIAPETLGTAVQKTSTDFHFGGYFIGLLLGIAGTILCYVANKKEIIRSAWYGFGTRIFLVFSLVVIFFIRLNSNDDNNRHYF